MAASLITARVIPGPTPTHVLQGATAAEAELAVHYLNERRAAQASRAHRPVLDLVRYEEPAGV